jgi:hypothetical protein
MHQIQSPGCRERVNTSASFSSACCAIQSMSVQSIDEQHFVLSPSPSTQTAGRPQLHCRTSAWLFHSHQGPIQGQREQASWFFASACELRAWEPPSHLPDINKQCRWLNLMQRAHTERSGCFFLYCVVIDTIWTPFGHQFDTNLWT